eukprot:4605470-Prymnesium_polylepis.1
MPLNALLLSRWPTKKVATRTVLPRAENVPRTRGTAQRGRATSQGARGCTRRSGRLEQACVASYAIVRAHHGPH